MADNKTNIIYSAENIQQYFEGKLSPEAMHAMEKAALDDPFLTEAMEGYQEMKDRRWQEQLAAAKVAVAGKENTKKVIPLMVSFKWWKAAAAVLVIVAGIGLAYFFEHSSLNNKENNTIAAVKHDTTGETETATIALAPSVTKTDSASRVVVIKDDETTLIAQVKPVHPLAAKPAAEAANRVADEQTTAALSEDKKQVADSFSIAAAPVGAATADEDLMKARKEEYNNAKALAKKANTSNKALALNNRFSVTVTGPDNSPLPFANVLVVDENIGTYADAKGKFKLASSDSVLNIRVRAAGFIPQVYTIKSTIADNRIVLNDQQVAAKDIVQLKNKKMPGTMPKMIIQLDTLLNVEPEDGWSNYDTYLLNNVSPYASITGKNIHGEVEVIFDVHKDGTLSNMNIAKSLCAACDAEALRVIKEGPQWKVKKGKKDKVKVKVQF